MTSHVALAGNGDLGRSGMNEGFVNDAVITVRFANPAFDCVAGTYCLDVQFQSDLEFQQVFGMNVRFFYEDLNLEFLEFRNYAPGYGAVPPDPPQILTSPPSFGYNYFGFGIPGNGPADWLNGAIQLNNPSENPIYLSTTDWTTLFQVCFTIDDPDPDSTGFCPPIVWDLKQDPSNGGYLAGDDGVVITLVDQSFESESLPSDEMVQQFNWMYTGDGSAPPYGMPVEENCIPISCGILLTCPANTTISCGQSTLPGNTGAATSEDHCPGIPVIIYSDSLVAGTCAANAKILRTWTASDDCGNHSTCLQEISIDSSGTICGLVEDRDNIPLGNTELQLFADLNSNGQVDLLDTVVDVTFSNALTGTYCFNTVRPCAYVIHHVLPENYIALSDYDHSADPDGDDSGEAPDHQIPVVLEGCEVDADNNFEDLLCPSTFPEVSNDTICEDGMVTFTITDPNNGLVAYSWDFGSGASSETNTGLGPHEVEYASTSENMNSGAAVLLTISKSGCPDYVEQVSEVMVKPYPDASIEGSTLSGCYYTDRIFVPFDEELSGALYAWNFGAGAVPASATGYGPHTVYYITNGTKNVTLVVDPQEVGADCIDSSLITFNINTCPANIQGTVKSVTNEPISGVNLRLYHDADLNGMPDDTNFVKSVFTNVNGIYVMSAIVPGHYVIVQVQPPGWISFDDGDESGDGDIVGNLDSLDNMIPVSLIPNEIDGINAFKEIGAPGEISGKVFNDLDGDLYPDTGEGIDGVTIELYADVNSDGIADNVLPLTNTVTAGDGSFVLEEVAGGHYVLVEVQPASYYSLLDRDVSNDVDAAGNTNLFDDVIPVSVTNAELDEHNYFAETDTCALWVINTNDYGHGTFRLAAHCAQDGDTIRFDQDLAGQTILIQSTDIHIKKDLVVYSEHSPVVKVASLIPGLVTIEEESEIEIHNLDITSGLACGAGAAFTVYGLVRLFDVNIHRNVSLPTTEYLIKLMPEGQLHIHGICRIESD